EPVAGLYAPARQEGVDPGLGGRVPRQRELDRGGPDAERLEQREVLLDHVARGGGRRHVAVREERAEALAAEPSGEADPERGARQPPAERRRDRQRVDDVTERRELHERDVHRKRSTIREIRSRVE